MKKLLFVLPSLAAGGAEKVTTILLNNLNRKFFKISLVLFEKKGELLDKVPEDVEIYGLKKKNRFSFFKLIFNLVEIIKIVNPDTVISFLEYANLVCLLAKKFVNDRQIRWVISERSLPSLSLLNMRFYHLKFFLHKLLDKTADFVIVNSLDTHNEMRILFKVPTEKIKIIPNPIEIEKIKKLAMEPIDFIWYKENIPIIISVGRLSKPKGYSYLIRAFAEVIKEIEARLLILGEGEERNNLQKLIKELSINDKVLLYGFVKNPYPYIANADIFVLSSLWEGFPNVLLEAMVLGKPVIATKCNSSINELVEDGVNGILVPPGDTVLLKNAILAILKNKALQHIAGEKNKEKVSKYDISQVIKKYEEVF